MTEPLLWLEAAAVANALAEQLRPFCERIEVAGSIRRHKPRVKDLELVAVPRFETRPADIDQPDMFAEPPPVEANLLDEEVARWLSRGYAEPRLDKNGRQALGPSYKRLLVYADGTFAEPVALDLFSVIAPAQFGLIFMIRTGSGVGPDGSPRMGFSPAVLARWKQVSGGGRSEAGCLRWPNGEQRETPEEEDVFEACRMRFVAPEERTDATVVGRYLLP